MHGRVLRLLHGHGLWGRPHTSGCHAARWTIKNQRMYERAGDCDLPAPARAHAPVCQPLSPLPPRLPARRNQRHGIRACAKEPPITPKREINTGASSAEPPHASAISTASGKEPSQARRRTSGVSKPAPTSTARNMFGKLAQGARSLGKRSTSKRSNYGRSCCATSKGSLILSKHQLRDVPEPKWQRTTHVWGNDTLRM